MPYGFIGVLPTKRGYYTLRHFWDMKTLSGRRECIEFKISGINEYSPRKFISSHPNSDMCGSNYLLILSCIFKMFNCL